MITMQDFMYMIPVVCGITVGILSAVKKLKGKSSNQKFIEKAKQDGCVVNATLVDTWVNARNNNNSAENDDPSLHALYEYYVDGKKYTKGLYFYKSFGREHDRFPQTKTIYYKKGNPKKAITDGEATNGDKMERGCLVSILYAIIVIAVLAWVFKWLGLIE